MEKQKVYLSKAVDRIFLNTDELGFWDEKNSRIHSKLFFSKNWNWMVKQEMSDRYGVFTIMMVLLAKFQQELDTLQYDTKIISYLKYIKTHISNYEKSTVTYGAFNALVLGQILYEDQGVNFNKEIVHTYQFIKNNISTITDNEDSLVLIGLSIYTQYLNNDKDILLYVDTLVQSLLKSQNTNGFFLSGDIRAVYHQRTMYTLWGLAFASSITHKEEIKPAIEKSISFIWNYRRDGKDNAFLWHPAIYKIKSHHSITFPVISIKSVNYLFECHQTFFANAISFYQYFYQTAKFSDYRQKALDWIFGENRINQNLVSITKLNIPTRIMSRNGEVYIKNQNFKGSYEVGSYVFALAVNNKKV